MRINYYKHKKTWLYEYIRTGDVSMLVVLKIRVFIKVGNMLNLFGILIKL